ncbi:hypothetical protein [Arthrobacter sp. PAMC 25486]|uniref:hypothetical protein n=1 Tax=Arthrobacter sp. PAMC 25486 TaxID=1494608 RepID=UPI00068D1A15|nr:hypothetical protein [Arthrobacter sp. PAMC 25486]
MAPLRLLPAVAGEPGYRMLISRAGGWTADFMDNPPSHVWAKGIPAAGVANAKRLFNRVLYVVTGSGIGPGLGHLPTDTQGARLVWVTKTPRSTYGDDLVDEVASAQPEAVIWNTSEQGKPDVICVSNKNVTDRIVLEFEHRGIPAFGPIWDPWHRSKKLPVSARVA